MRIAGGGTDDARTGFATIPEIGFFEGGGAEGRAGFTSTMSASARSTTDGTRARAGGIFDPADGGAGAATRVAAGGRTLAGRGTTEARRVVATELMILHEAKLVPPRFVDKWRRSSAPRDDRCL